MIEKQTIIEAPYDTKIVNYFTKLDKTTLDKILDSYKYIAREFLAQVGDYHMIPIKLSGRLKSTFGYYATVRSNNHHFIELNKQQVILDYRNKTDIMVDTLKHELVHYTCDIDGLDDNDGSYDFESRLAKYEICSSGSTDDSLKITNKALEYYAIKDVYTGTSKKTGKVLEYEKHDHTIKPKFLNRNMIYKVNGKYEPIELERTSFLITKNTCKAE